MAESGDAEHSQEHSLIPSSLGTGPQPSKVSLGVAEEKEALSDNHEASEESDSGEESESFECEEESSDSESISSESELVDVEQHISKVKAMKDYDRSIHKLSSLTKHTFRILNFYVRKHGETNCRLAKYFLNYAESFFMYLRLQLESGSHDENEDASVEDDWDVLCECLRRSISGFDRLLKVQNGDRIEDKSTASMLRKALEMLVWVFVYREDKNAALKAAEELSERFPCPASSLILAEMHVLCEHFSTAKSIISTLRASTSSPVLTVAEKEKTDELYELLFENDASNIKWDVGNYVRNEYSFSVKQGSTGNVVTAFSKPTSNEGTSTEKSTNILTTRRKRKDPDVRSEGEI